MSQVMSVADVINITCPKKSARYSVLQLPNIGGLYTAKVTISEAGFQKTMATRAASLAQAPSNLGSRNELVRGVMVKPETFATLEIAEANKEMDEKGQATKFAEFLLQSVSEATEERYQLVETFGDTVGFFFGTRPKIYQYSGVLLNTTDCAWRDNWKDKYENEFRGTKCVDSKKRAYLTYDYVLREGYILGMSIGQISATPNNVDFSFTMFITRELNLQPTNFQQIQAAMQEEKNLKDTNVIEEIRKKWKSATLPPEKYIKKFTSEEAENVDEERVNLGLMSAPPLTLGSGAKMSFLKNTVLMDDPIKVPLGTNDLSGLAACSRDNPVPSMEEISKCAYVYSANNIDYTGIARMGR